MSAGKVAAAGIAAFVVLALLAPVLAPFDPAVLDTAGPFATPSAEHWLGTDQLGRDVWSRWLYGARVSLGLGFAVTTLAASFGLLLGAVAGYAGGITDRAVSFAIDGLLSLPRLVLVLAVVGIVRVQGPERLVLLVVLLAGTSWMPLARVVRAEVQSLADRDFVLAARALGLAPLRILTVHVVPHVLPFALVYGALAIGHAILAEATLSYLGLGVSAPTASWGSLVAEGSTAIRRAPWLVLGPGLSITALVLAFNALADAIRDALDPRLRGGGNFTGD